MRVVKSLATILVLLTALAGCGQKGGLYRDHPEVSAPAVMTPANTLPGSSATDGKKESGK